MASGSRRLGLGCHAGLHGKPALFFLCSVTIPRPAGVPADAPMQVVKVAGGYWLSEKAAHERYAEAEQSRAENASLWKNAGLPLKPVGLALLGEGGLGLRHSEAHEVSGASPAIGRVEHGGQWA